MRAQLFPFRRMYLCCKYVKFLGEKIIYIMYFVIYLALSSSQHSSKQYSSRNLAWFEPTRN